jgi:hypothetical protein
MSRSASTWEASSAPLWGVPGVDVGVLEGSEAGVAVGCGVFVGSSVGDGDGDGVGVGVRLAVAVAVGDGVKVDVGLAVTVAVGGIVSVAFCATFPVGAGKGSGVLVASG